MIAQKDLDHIISRVESQGLSETLIGELRTQFNEYHFTYCMDDDMGSYKPAIASKTFNIYFVDSSDHCSKLTPSQEHASGMVLAEVYDDEI